MITTPSVGLSISNAAKSMNKNCIEKIKNSGIAVSESVMAENEQYAKSNKSTGNALAAVAVIGFVAFVIWMLL